MSTVKKCPKCGHVWVPRVPNPAECPKCQIPLARAFRESVDLVDVIDATSIERRLAEEARGEVERVEFAPRLYVSSFDFAILSDEEWQKKEDKFVEDYREWLQDLRLQHRERQRKLLIEKAWDIEAHYSKWAAHMDRNPPSISQLKIKLETVLRRNQVEERRKEWVDSLEFLTNWNPDKLLEEWLKDTEISRRVQEHSGYVPEEKKRQLAEETKIVQLTIPRIKEIIAVYDQRIDELKKAEVDVVPLKAEVDKLDEESKKIAPKINKLIDEVCIADTRNKEKEVDRLVAQLKSLIPQYDQLQLQRDQTTAKIVNDCKIDLIYNGFAPINRERLRDRPNVILKLGW